MKIHIFPLLVMLLAMPVAQCQNLLISEVLFNPAHGGSDYVELFNNSDNAASLKGLCLVQWKDDSTMRSYALPEQYSVQPHQYVVFTTDAAFVSSTYTVRHSDRIVELDAMPPLNDDSGTIILATSDGTVLDRFVYTEKMHNPLLHDVEGVALERRSFDVATQSAGNWFSAASTAGYGTPTSPNSQSTEFLFLEERITVSPTLFSPDGDGYDDLLNISYLLSDGSLSANITLFDAQGRRQRRLASGASLGTQGILTWDGTRDDGSRCLPGQYLLIIDTYNTQGRHQLLKRTVTLVP